MGLQGSGTLAPTHWPPPTGAPLAPYHIEGKAEPDVEDEVQGAPLEHLPATTPQQAQGWPQQAKMHGMGARQGGDSSTPLQASTLTSHTAPQ